MIRLMSIYDPPSLNMFHYPTGIVALASVLFGYGMLFLAFRQRGSRRRASLRVVGCLALLNLAYGLWDVVRRLIMMYATFAVGGGLGDRSRMFENLSIALSAPWSLVGAAFFLILGLTLFYLVEAFNGRDSE